MNRLTRVAVLFWLASLAGVAVAQSTGPNNVWLHQIASVDVPASKVTGLEVKSLAGSANDEGVVGILYECPKDSDVTRVTPGAAIQATDQKSAKLDGQVQSLITYKISLESNEPLVEFIGQTYLYGSPAVSGSTLHLKQHEYVLVRSYARVQVSGKTEGASTRRLPKEIQTTAAVYTLRAGLPGWYPRWSFQTPITLTVEPPVQEQH